MLERQILENGKGKYLDIVEYDREMGEYHLSEEDLNKLKGKSLMEQVDCYKAVVTSSLCFYSYGKDEGGSMRGWERSFWEESDIEGIIVDNGIIVGVKAKKFLYGLCNLFPGETINTYSACDEDGTGGRDRDDYLKIEIK